MTGPVTTDFGTVTFRGVTMAADQTKGSLRWKPNPQTTITFSPRVQRAANADDQVAFLPSPITCRTDSDGYLIDPDGERGIRLVATDDADMTVTGWTYEVVISSPGTQPQRFDIQVPKGKTLDLAMLQPVPSKDGTYYLVGPRGPVGPAPVWGTPTVTTGAPGSAATVSTSGTGVAGSPLVLKLGVPRGDKGEKGNTGPIGPLPVVGVPTISTGAAGSSAAVTATGTGGAGSPWKLAFTIPRGDSGAAVPIKADFLKKPSAQGVPVGSLGFDAALKVVAVATASGWQFQGVPTFTSAAQRDQYAAAGNEYSQCVVAGYPQAKQGNDWGAIASQRVAELERNTVRSIGNKVFTTIPFEVHLRNDGYQVGSSVIVPWAGWYRVGITVYWASNEVGSRRLYVPGFRHPYVDGSAVQSNYFNAVFEQQLAAGANISPQAYQSSGGPLDLNAARMTVTFCGP